MPFYLTLSEITMKASSIKEKIIFPTALCFALGLLTFTPLTIADQLYNDDLIIKGSLCVGLDCVNGESFNFDTIRLKENNVRIRFIDSSSTSSFPSNDWEITANESSNGGLNRFYIQDITGSTVPFSIMAGAPNNGFYMLTDGRIGLGTNTPAVELQIKDGNSPTMRLEQDGSSGFTAQSWDVAGNETNFFIRDATNSGKIPFKIVPNAPNNSLYIAADGDIGFETSTPDGIFDIAHPNDANNHAVLVSPVGNFGINIDNGFVPNSLFEIQSTGGVTEFSVASNGDTAINGTATITGNTTVTGNTTFNSNVYVNSAGRIGINSNDFSDVLGVTPLLKIESGTAHAGLTFNNTDANYTSGLFFLKNNAMQWYISSRNDFSSGNGALFFIDSSATAPTLALFQNQTIGLGGIQTADASKVINHSNGAYLSSGGVWTNNSSRAAKKDIVDLSLSVAKKALEQLAPVTYEYITEPGETYAGFIAEDVPEIVATNDKKNISSMDVVAVLTKVVQDQQRTIESLTHRLKKLEKVKEQ